MKKYGEYGSVLAASHGCSTYTYMQLFLPLVMVAASLAHTLFGMGIGLRYILQFLPIRPTSFSVPARACGRESRTCKYSLIDTKKEKINRTSICISHTPHIGNVYVQSLFREQVAAAV